MTWHVSALVVVSFATSAIAASVAVIAWRRRAAPGARALALLMLAVTEWTFFRGLEAAADDVATKVWWAKIEYVGVNSIGALWLVFALDYARQVRLPPRSLGLLSVVPALSVLLALTNEHHHLIWTEIQRNPKYPAVLMYGHGAWFWVMVAYTYVLLATGAVVLVMAIARFPAAFRRQAAALLLAVALPWCGNLVYLIGLSPIPGLDLTPLAMTLSGIIGAWVVLRRDLFDLIPIARETLVEKLADGVIVLDERARIIDVNPAGARALGLASSVVGAPAAAVLAPWPDLLAALEGSGHDTGEMVSAGARLLDFRVSRLLDVRQRVTGSLVSLRDVTERHRTEQEVRRLNEQLEERVAQRTAELRLSQERFETLARVAPVGIYRTDASAHITYVNETWRDITGLRAADALGAGYLEAIHPDDRERFATWWAPTAGSPEQHPIEVRIKRPNGAVVWVMNHLMAEVGSDGIVRGAIGTLVDITELKRAQEQQARLASLVENSPDLVAILGPEGQLVYVNAAGRRLVGLGDVEDARTRTMLDFMAPEGRALVEEVIALALRDQGSWDGEAPLRRLDTGEIVVLAGRCFVLHRATDDGAQRIAIVGRDITERKRAEAALRESEAQLRQAQKMEAVGRLAGGIAHDFNNLMAIVAGQGELLEDMGAAEDERRDSLVLIQEAARRAIGLTRQLLAISRKQVLQRIVLDLNEVIGSVSDLLQRVMGGDIEVSIALAPDLGRVRADRGQIEQVLLNLVLNARDAMRQGGRLTIETGNATLQTGTAPGQYVMLTLSDTGTGIPPEILAHIFEPFVTTKGPGEGTGLGLATVHGIIQQHDGRITVDSAVGRGSTFRLYLPLVTDPVVAQAEPTEATPHGHETILVVEDEPDVRTVIKRSLQALGYTVIEASGAEEALCVMDTRGDSVELVLTDVVMPRKSGRELVDELRRRWPGLPVIFMSAYADEAIANHALDDPGVVLVPKPFTRSDLARAVRAMLDQSRGAPPLS